jgi:hypothetical protein
MITKIWPDAEDETPPPEREGSGAYYYVLLTAVVILLAWYGVTRVTDRIQTQQEKYRPDIHYAPRP